MSRWTSNSRQNSLHIGSLKLIIGFEEKYITNRIIQETLLDMMWTFGHAIPTWWSLSLKRKGLQIFINLKRKMVVYSLTRPSMFLAGTQEMEHFAVYMYIIIYLFLLSTISYFSFKQSVNSCITFFTDQTAFSVLVSWNTYCRELTAESAIYQKRQDKLSLTKNLQRPLFSFSFCQ